MGVKTVRIIVSIGPIVSTVLLSAKSPIPNKDFCPSLCAAGDSLRYFLLSCYSLLVTLTSDLFDVEEDGVGLAVEAVEGGDGVAEAGLGVGYADAVEGGQRHDGLAVVDV